MSDMASGQVATVRKNDKGYFSLKLEDGTWYGCGQDRPPCVEGDSIEFAFDMNGKFKNADVDSIVVIEAEPAPKKATPPARKSYGNGKYSGGAKGQKVDTAKEAYWNAKEARDIEWQQRQQAVQEEIRFQASRNAAVEIVTAAVAAGAIDLGDGKKKDSKLGVMLAYISKITDQYVKDTAEVYTAALASVKGENLAADSQAEPELFPEDSEDGE